MSIRWAVYVASMEKKISLKERENLENLGIDGCKILKAPLVAHNPGR
jgi:hypothetical protein